MSDKQNDPITFYLMASDPFPQPGSTPEPDFGAAGEPVVPTPLPPLTSGVPSESPLATASTSQSTDSGLTPNLAALLAVLFPPFTSLIFLFLEKRNAFVRFWAMQGVFLGGAAIVFGIISAVIGTILAHIFFLLAGLWFIISSLVNLAFMVVWIVMLIKAYGGKEWEAPVIGKLASQQLTRGPLA